MAAHPESAATGVPLPPIRTDIASAKQDLDAFGLARFAGAIDEAELCEARERLIEQAAGEDAAGIGFHDGGEGSTKTHPNGPNQRVFNLLNKGEVFRRIAMNRVGQELMAHVLGDDFLLSSFGANIACRGGLLGDIHGDQAYAPADTPYALAANAMWMLSPFTEENGATRVIPGSHLWRRFPSPGAPEPPTVAAIGPAGAVMVFDGRLWHGTGASRVDDPRYALLGYCCRPFVRQQENYALSLAPDVLAHCPSELRDRLGFKVWNTLGRTFGPGAPGTVVTRPTEYVTELRPTRP